MNWLEVSGNMMLNLDVIRAISKEDGYESRIFVSDNESFTVPIQYETLSSLIRMKVRDRSNSTDDIQRSLRTLSQGSFTPVP